MNEVKWSSAEQRKLEKTLHQTHDARLYKRTLAVLECSRGKGVVQVAKSLGVTRQSVHTWVAKFKQAGHTEVLMDGPRPGRPRQADEAVQVLLRLLIGLSPEQYGYAATQWNVSLLKEQVCQTLQMACCEETIRRCLHRMGYRWKRPRYVLAADPQREKKAAYPALAWQAIPAHRDSGRR